MLLSLIDFYADGNKARFSRKIGVKPQTINTWLNRGNFDTDLIYSKCEHLSAEWVLTGRGAMINGKIEPESPVELGCERSEAGDDELSINSPHGAEIDLSTLSERLKAMVRLMEMKDKLLQEKERTIQILMRGFPAECAQMDEGGHK